MKVAALDLGSNTFLLLVAEVMKNRVTKIYRDESQVTKLGQGVHANRSFHPEALARAESCFRDYSEIIKQEKPERILAMATSAARDVTNGDELFRLGKKYDIPIEIIPGHLEAQITYQGATFDLPDTSGVAVIDVGGGSTEVIARSAQGQPEGVSVDVGSVRLTEMFVTKHPISVAEVDKIIKYTEQKFSEAKALLPKAKIKQVLGVAGTPTTLAAVLQKTAYSDDKVHGYTITTEQLQEQIHYQASLPLSEREALVGMDPKRADVIVAGMCILLCGLRSLGMSQLTVSTRGVRYGVAIHLAQQ
jgi:exopolyphosphatase/guanosine-5'-triphosphate,3'-diphosphate pyrophosphatase